MIKLLTLLQEIKIKGPTSRILLKNFEYDKDIDSKYPVYKLSYRGVYNSENFNWWKLDMIRTYGDNLILIKKPNLDKEHWYHGKYQLEVPEENNPENLKYWGK